MTNDSDLRIDLTSDNQRTDAASPAERQSKGLGFEALEHRITPLVVIAIIAILIGLLLPAVQPR